MGVSSEVYLQAATAGAGGQAAAAPAQHGGGGRGRGAWQPGSSLPRRPSGKQGGREAHAQGGACKPAGSAGSAGLDVRAAVPAARACVAPRPSHDVWLPLHRQRAPLPGVDGHLLAADGHPLPQVQRRAKHLRLPRHQLQGRGAWRSGLELACLGRGCLPAPPLC